MISPDLFLTNAHVEQVDIKATTMTMTAARIAVRRC